MDKKAPYVVIAAGGTGGHIFPAQALAEFLMEKKVYVPVFVTDTRGAGFLGAKTSLMENGITIPTIRLSARDFLKLPLGLMRFMASVVKLTAAFYKLKPVVIVGFGGYASFPALLAALVLRIPIMLHESNAVMGRTNRWFMFFSAVIMLSFAYTKGVSKRLLHKVEVTGTPVRSSIVNAKHKNGASKEEVNILIIGGSQGARIISEAVPFAISMLPDDLRQKLAVWQQVREGQVDEAIKVYKRSVKRFVVSTFFPDEPGAANSIADLMSQADLVIARAGASTISEITTLGKASILIPFAAAKDNHQYYNALHLADSGAAIIVEESKDIVRDLIAAIALLSSDVDKRLAMAKKAATSIHINSTASMMKIIDRIAIR